MFGGGVKSTVYIDNQAAIELAKNDGQPGRLNILILDFTILEMLLSSGVTTLSWVSTSEQLADILTKSLGTTIFCGLRNKLLVPGTTSKNNTGTTTAVVSSKGSVTITTSGTSSD